jgi:surfeit locus 1 family protein
MRFWLITLAALAGMLLTASLGRWQLSRAAEKQAMQTALDERTRMRPIGAPELLAGADTAGAQALVHRAVVLEGRWLPEHTVYLDNRQMLGRPGFYVLTPLQLSTPGSTAVLVQRGWIPRGFEDRTRLAPVQTPAGTVRIEGRIALPPSRLFEFGGTAGSEGSSRIRQNLDLAAFRTETGLPLANLTVLQTGTASDGLQRDWPVAGAGIDKHYGYAFQWFGLCGLIATLYVWFQIVRRFIRPRSQPAA